MILNTLNLEETIRWREGVKTDCTIVFTNGCFDIIHSGHVDYLKKAKMFGDYLIIGLNSDSSIKKIKGNNRPIICEEQRKFILESILYVTKVIIFNESTPLTLIEKIKPDILVKGSDWDLDDIVGKDFVLSYGGRVERVDFKYNISTSKIIDKIVKNYGKK